MTLKKKDIKLLETVFEELEVKYGIKHNNDYFEEETDTIYFEFPREFEDIEYEVEEVLGIFSEIDTLEIHDLNRVTTDTITQRAVTASEVDPFLYLGFFSQVVINNIHLKIIDSPILIGIAATEKDEYTKYYPPCSPHIAVQVDYPNKESRLSV